MLADRRLDSLGRWSPLWHALGAFSGESDRSEADGTSFAVRGRQLVKWAANDRHRRMTEN